MTRLQQRLTRLEKARRAPGADPPYTYPEVSESWYREVLTLLWEHGLFTSVEDLLLQCLGISDDESIAAVKALLLTGDNPEKETYGAELQ